MSIFSAMYFLLSVDNRRKVRNVFVNKCNIEMLSQKRSILQIQTYLLGSITNWLSTASLQGNEERWSELLEGILQIPLATSLTFIDRTRCKCLQQVINGIAFTSINKGSLLIILSYVLFIFQKGKSCFCQPG